MKSAIIAALIGSAAAFAPAQNKAATTALNAFEDELGVQPPLGFFDPFGLLSGDVTQERFDRLRYVEIKHGRIAQLAFLGQIVTRAGIHLPGNIDYAGNAFDSFPNGQGQIIAFIGWLEIAFMRDVPGTGNEHVGDFRNGYIDFGWDDFDEETKLQKRAIELNNGRAAMFGILGLMVHEEIVPLGYDADLPIIGHL
ncbi:fucoxanthin-chlorophyll a-c binding protein [Skeletonema marinoi]|uniref:Fucoxanthin-chlorophyll a-c binding protein n=1 Tax=Skeletonema marinoi TaxID=267567 RepID=A0AAD8YNH7_9STRA|nr:fucoxanthin-chlorophyll a-c binding protein [Skeletonema marinoi]